MDILRQACVIALVLLASTTPSNGESPADDGRDFARLDMLLASRTFLKPAAGQYLRELAARVPEQDRVLLYYSHRHDQALLGLGLNCLLPPLGSTLQFDRGGAVVGGVLVWGALPFVYFGLLTTTLWADPDTSPPKGMLYGGIAAMAAGMVFLLVRPFWWSSIWNDRLADALLLSPKPPVGGLSSASPGEVPSQGPLGSIEIVLLRFSY